MSIPGGTRMGSYEILGPLGAGGMGEVYRARDTKLGRDVALKILPEQFVANPERLARFQREAELLAALNHPNIAAIYGLEETDGRRTLVLELVEGPTLADRIAQGAMPIDEALPVARQIAMALEAAHEHGIIHRDLKPANIKVRPDGTVKVLDFGLAKALETETSPPVQSDSPTMSRAATHAGVILGTAAYMSPEQAKGLALDRRSDLFAFGAVLYQMLVGQPAFRGETVADILAAVIRATPAWERLPADAPTGLRRLLQRCLEKDRARRLQTAADARIRIEDVEVEGEPTGIRAPAGAEAWEKWRWVVGSALSIAVVALAFAAGSYFRGSPPTDAPEMRLEVTTPRTSARALVSFALSPDGRQIVFVAEAGGPRRLWLRRLDATTAQPLAGTDGAGLPFWAPDNRSVGFFADGKLKRVDLDGGVPQTLADADPRGGTWSQDGTILFQRFQSGLLRVAASGGEPVAVTSREPTQAGHRFPHFLPDGRRFLFYVRGTPDTSGIYLGSLDSPKTTRLAAAASPGGVYAPSGWVLFVRGDTLLAQRLDLERGSLTGNPVTVAESVVLFEGEGGFSASSTGLMAYRAGATGLRRQLTWFDRTGKTLGTLGTADASLLSSPRLSLDGRWAAAQRTVQGNQDVWLLDGTRTTRFTFDRRSDRYPVWSPDGGRIVFSSNRSGFDTLFLKPANGAGKEELLLESAPDKFPTDWSRDGRFLAWDQNPGDLVMLPMQGDRKPFEFLKTDFVEAEARFSPDGRWVAYKSNESGQFEVYVRPFSGTSSPSSVSGQWQVSTAGGQNARWRADGRELYYVSPDATLMAVPIAVGGATLVPGTPVALFRTEMVGGGSAFVGEDRRRSRRTLSDQHNHRRRHAANHRDPELEAARAVRLGACDRVGQFAQPEYRASPVRL